MKDSRYYEIVGETVYIYSAPYPQHSVSVSIVRKADLAYYRNNFNLEKIWKDSNHVHNQISEQFR